MVKQIYNFIFNSAIGTGVTTSDNFFFDWSRIPDVPYTVTFCFNSANCIPLNTTVANVFMDLGQSDTFIVMPQNARLAQQANYLGFLRTTGTGQYNYFYASEPDNPPIFLNGRPRSNNILVSINTNGVNQTSAFAPEPVQYTLSLCLREC